MDPTSPPPFAKPDPIARASWALCGTTVLVTLIATTILSSNYSDIELILEDFDMELPTGSRLLAQGSPLILVASGFILIAGLITKEVFIRSKTATLYVNVAALILVVILFETVRYFQFLPFFHLIQSVSGG